jgi:hypothetical protein
VLVVLVMLLRRRPLAPVEAPPEEAEDPSSPHWAEPTERPQI